MSAVLQEDQVVTLRMKLRAIRDAFKRAKHCPVCDPRGDGLSNFDGKGVFHRASCPLGQAMDESPCERDA